MRTELLRETGARREGGTHLDGGKDSQKFEGTVLICQPETEALGAP